jgi:glutamate/aspartate transport system substrate-binding protein
MKRLLKASAALLALCVGMAQAADGPTLARVRDTGVIVIGYRPASLPFSYLDAQLRPTGYTVELCDRIVDAVSQKLQLPDLEVRRVEVASATRMPLVINGTLDLECGITTHTAERARNQAFSLTIFVAETRLLARAAERVQSLADLRGKPVASTIGTPASSTWPRSTNSRRWASASSAAWTIPRACSSCAAAARQRS